MADYLPQMEMPPEPIQEEAIEEQGIDPLVSRADNTEGSVKMEIKESINEETEEENPNFEYSDEEAEEEEPLPVEPKKKLQREEVFKTPKVMAVNEPIKEKKKRKPPSERQLAALAKARENMKLKREEAKRLKAEGKPTPASKRKQKQQKEVKEEIQKQGQLYTQDQIASITANAIEQYDMKRKARKEQKAVTKEKDNQEQKVKETLSRAMGMAPPQRDMWDDALGGMWN